jgi:hypothetical protein
MLVILWAMHRIRMWSSLQSTERQEDLATKYNQLEKVAGDLYNQWSWLILG